MKKTFILLATIFGLCSTTYAQTIFEKSNTIVFERIKKDKKETLKRNFDWTTYNRGKDINSFGVIPSSFANSYTSIRFLL